MNRNELLNLKRRLVALSLAGGCLVALTGCGDSEVSESNTVNLEIVNEMEEKEQRHQLLAIYEEKAVIIEPYNIYLYEYGSYYGVSLDSDGTDFCLPISQFIYFKDSSPITAEDYVATVCGPDFPIEYIRSEDYNRSR